MAMASGGEIHYGRQAPIIGVMIPPEFEPESVMMAVRSIEEAGFAELWITEDCGYSGGFTMAATALSAVDSLRVGMAITPALARNSVFLAMEIATLCRLYPHRFLPGIGHGWPPWMENIGVNVASPLTAMEEVVEATRRLLQGEPVTLEGVYVKLHNALLTHPPKYSPPISLGVSQVKSLQLSGRIADGTILSEGASPAYVSRALAAISTGLANCDQPRQHRISVISWCEISEDIGQGCERLRPIVADFLTSGALNPQLAALGLKYESSGSVGNRSDTEPDDDFILKVAIVGNPNECLRRLKQLFEAGADAVILRAATTASHVQLVERLSTFLPYWLRSLMLGVSDGYVPFPANFA